MKTNNFNRLSLQERVLAGAALRQVGSATIDYALSASGNRVHDNQFDDNAAATLVNRFRADPKSSLGYLRQNLLAINQDKHLSTPQRQERLGRYWDAYTDLTVKLDRAAFAETDSGAVHLGVPDYIPDGLVDMGSNPSTDPRYRGGRDQIKVDKAAIYKKYRSTLLEIFSTDYTNVPSSAAKRHMAKTLMQAIYFTLPYDKGRAARDNGPRTSGITHLHEMSEGVCRHQALTYQVLAQACGLTSRLVKCHMDGERHAANATRIDYQWYFIDVTNPDYTATPHGKLQWEPAAYKIPHEPQDKDDYTFTKPHSGVKHHYTVRDDMCWRLDM